MRQIAREFQAASRSLLRLPDGPWEMPDWPATPYLDVEIGCGVGMHAIRYAADHPDRTLVAVERTKEKFQKFYRRLAQHRPFENLVAVHTDATAWICHALNGRKLDRVFILYPNPYPKNSAQRWIRAPFMRHLVGQLKPFGEITFATNLDWYADEIEAQAEYSDLVVAERKKIRVTHSLDQDIRSDSFSVPLPRTHFEKKYLLRGETCWHIMLKPKLD